MLDYEKIIKSFLGYIYCFLYGVKYHHGIYVGLGAKLMGGKNTPFKRCKKYASSHVGFSTRKYRNW